MKKAEFKKAIREGKSVLGTGVQMNSPEIVEILGKAGFDFVMIDTEHSYFGLETAENLIRAADASGIVPIVRVSHKNPTLIMKALDMGAQGVVVPGISTKEDAVAAVRASKYPPLGNRGACPFVRAAGHMASDWKAFSQNADESTVVFLLVEGTEGVKNFEEIISVEGIDVIAVGPFDLSVSLGVGGQVDHPLVVDKLKEMVSLALRKNIALNTVVFELEEDKIRSTVEYWFNLGIRVMMVGGDKAFLSHISSVVLKAMSPKQ